MTDDLRIQLQEQARQAQFWRAEAERWQKLWERAANRIEAQADELKRLERILSSDNPNPWKDV
jgi:hypothetical protein